MSDRLRLFVAAYPPAEHAEAMLAALRRLPLSRHREVAAAHVHMTLQFIGERSARELDGVLESVERSCSGIGAFSLMPRELITLPERGAPRLVAAETDAPAGLLEVHSRLAHRLAREPRRNASDRFRPHLTLCRFARDERPPRVSAPLDLPPFAVDRVRLMRSILKADGAEHAEVAAFPLDEPRPQTRSERTGGA
ncbi:MAG TPA: RNA 2',3'-cyclic phosphodiesterase [Phycisphaerales bacterium]|nr:RNA 2',3'-cyclic phosphodiesterase [Phycisphaerales bacterium]